MFMKLSSFRTPLAIPHDVVALAPVDERWSCTRQRRGDLTVTYVFLRVGHRYLDYDLVGGP